MAQHLKVQKGDLCLLSNAIYWTWLVLEGPTENGYEMVQNSPLFHYLLYMATHKTPILDWMLIFIRNNTLNLVEFKDV